MVRGPRLRSFATRKSAITRLAPVLEWAFARMTFRAIQLTHTVRNEVAQKVELQPMTRGELGHPDETHPVYPDSFLELLTPRGWTVTIGTGGGCGGLSCDLCTTSVW